MAERYFGDLTGYANAEQRLLGRTAMLVRLSARKLLYSSVTNSVWASNVASQQ